MKCTFRRSISNIARNIPSSRWKFCLDRMKIIQNPTSALWLVWLPFNTCSRSISLLLTPHRAFLSYLSSCLKILPRANQVPGCHTGFKLWVYDIISQMFLTPHHLLRIRSLAYPVHLELTLPSSDHVIRFILVQSELSSCCGLFGWDLAEVKVKRLVSLVAQKMNFTRWKQKKNIR